MPGKHSIRDHKIYILTGDPGSGKSNFLDNLVKILKGHGLLPAGFTAPSIPGALPSRSYELKDLSTGKSMPLASETAEDNWLRTGKFYFNPETVQYGNRILMDENICKNDLIIIDEIGHFELQGKIWAEAITTLSQKNCSPMLWSVRNSLLDRVIQNWELADPVVIRIEDHSPEEAAKIILLYSQLNTKSS